MVEPVTEWERLEQEGLERDRLSALEEKEREDERRSGPAALRAEIADLRNEVEVLRSRVASLESRGRR